MFVRRITYAISISRRPTCRTNVLDQTSRRGAENLHGVQLFLAYKSNHARRLRVRIAIFPLSLGVSRERFDIVEQRDKRSSATTATRLGVGIDVFVFRYHTPCVLERPAVKHRSIATRHLWRPHCCKWLLSADVDKLIDSWGRGLLYSSWRRPQII